MTTVLIVEKVETGWRAIIADVEVEDENFSMHINHIQSIAEHPDLRIAVDAAILDLGSKPMPTHLLMPDGTLDSGDALTLAEVAEAVYGE